MGVPVLIIGKSGSGKSASLRNLDWDSVALINVLGKPMPFRARLKLPQLVTEDYNRVTRAIVGAKRDIIVIDDAGYLITNQFMRGQLQGGTGNAIFALYNQLAGNYWELTNTIRALPDEKRVYLIMHEEESDSGNIKPKTAGKLLDEKVCIEGLFTICLRAQLLDGRHVFKTQSNGLDVAKSPMGMFEGDEIDNDLKAVDDAIVEYYGIYQREDVAE